MSFNSDGLTSSAISRVRLTVGDIAEDFPILDDSVYEYLLYKNSENELETAIEALENIINYYSLNPEDETFGNVEGGGYNPQQMEKRLKALKRKRYEDGSKTEKIPMIIKSDRGSWNDFNKLFGKEDL